MKLLVVLPTYNERANVDRVVDGICQHDRAGVLVVDDASPDGTGAAADALAVKYPGRVEVMHRTGARGLGRAYVDGLRRALETGADAIGQMDADLSHDPASLPDLLDGLAQYDVVIGSRYVPGGRVVKWPLHRVLLSSFANKYIRAITGIGARDCTSGFRVWRRQALAGLQPFDLTKANGYAFLTEMLFQAAARGYRIGERPITFVERSEGYSKVSTRVLAESMLTPWRLRLSGVRLPRGSSHHGD